MRNDFEDIHKLWDDPDYADVRRRLADRLLVELIDCELGDLSVLLREQSVARA